MNKLSTKNQIVFVNQSAGYLIIDIINAHIDEFEERILLTGFLHPRNNPLDKTVKIEKLIRYQSNSIFKRIFSWAWALIQIIIIVKFKYPKAHLVLFSNPPLTICIPFICNNSFDIVVYDIYPDTLVEFGYFKPNNWIIKKWETANRKMFAKANKIVTLTDGMKNRLSNYVDEIKIKVVPIWTDNAFLKPIKKAENTFLINNQLQNKFVVMYSGNMGKSHPVELLIELADYFQESNKICFLLIGGGEKYKSLEISIQKKELKNIKILPWQDTLLLPYTLSGADLAFVTVGSEASDLSIPSKTYNLMSVGTPILCVAPKLSALANLIDSENMGSVFQEDDFLGMVEYINKCIEDIEFHENLRQNALKASLNYTPLNAHKFL